MSHPSVPAHASAITEADDTISAHIGQQWLLVVQLVCTVLMLLITGSFIASIPARLSDLHYVCSDTLCEEWQISPELARTLGDLGVTIGAYAVIGLVIESFLLLVYVGIAAMIFWYRRDQRMALFTAVFLVAFGATLSPTTQALAELDALSVIPLQYAGPWALIASLLILYLFPDGRFQPRWTRWVTGMLVGLAIATMLFSPLVVPNLVSFVGWITPLGIGVFAQVYRYRRISSPIQRQQTKWVVYGMVTMSAGLVAASLPGVLFPSLTEPGAGQAIHHLMRSLIAVGSLSLLPLAFGIAILRYRLWDIDILVNRTLVYTALTASIIGTYVLIVGSIGTLIQDRDNLLVSLLAAGFVAVLFQPARDRLQHTVNRLMYGERDDPYAVLARLGHRLEASLSPTATLPTIVETFAQALKLPYVAIALRRGDSLEIVAATGREVATPTRLPLVYQNEPIGELLLAPRSPGEDFSPADHRLLADLARQAGVAAHAVELTIDLQRSREQLITAREEERRRLRRDLHDGLGPALASMTLQAEAARDLVGIDPSDAITLLTDLTDQLQTATADIRRLVYALRPPALDDLGLIGAIRAQAAHYDHSGIQVTIDASEPLSPLPAAVEVAAYRIMQEALTNVVRHARAQRCLVRVSLADALEIEVSDDGIGIPAAGAVGVGRRSMGERAAELGGTCTVESRPGGGTRVVARLPLRVSAETRVVRTEED